MHTKRQLCRDPILRFISHVSSLLTSQKRLGTHSKHAPSGQLSALSARPPRHPCARPLGAPCMLPAEGRRRIAPLHREGSATTWLLQAQRALVPTTEHPPGCMPYRSPGHTIGWLRFTFRPSHHSGHHVSCPHFDMLGVHGMHDGLW